MKNREQIPITYLAGKYIAILFAGKLSSDLVFHNFHHTSNVVKGVKEIGSQMSLNSEQMEILTLAAWFHDSGHIIKYNGHEEESKHLAEDWLKKNNYPKSKREQVLDCIIVTHLPQQPTSVLQEVICDADLYHLAIEEYCHLQFQLREECKRIFQKEYTDKKWMKENLDFLNKHRYFTAYGKSILEKKKQLNIEKCKQMLKEY